MSTHVAKVLSKKALPLLTSIISLLLIIVILFLFSWTFPSIKSGIIIDNTSKEERSITLPHSEFSTTKREYTYRFNFFHNFFQQAKISITPDDQIVSIELNNQQIDLSKFSSSQLSDFHKGIVLNLKDKLVDGENELILNIVDHGGKFGLKISQTIEDPLFQILFFSFILLILVFIYSSFSFPKSSKFIFFLLSIGLIVRVYYLLHTPWDVRSHDYGVHTSYIEYIAENYQLPPIEYAVKDYFHPPFYFSVSAIIYKVLSLFSFEKVQIYFFLQIAAVLYSMVFLLFGLLTIQFLLKSISGLEKNVFGKIKNTDLLFAVSSCLLVFWPSTVIHSVRVGNDPLLYMFYSMGLYYCVKWQFTDERQYLFLASTIAALGHITKANGVFLFATIGVVFIVKFFKKTRWKEAKKLALAPLLLFIVSTAITYYPGVYLKIQGKRDRLFIDNITKLSKANWVNNHAENYLWIDLKTFITQPYTDPYDDRFGRQYFGNYLGKTGLFGEFRYEGNLARNSAVVISFLAVLMFIYTVIGLTYAKKEDLKFCMIMFSTFGFLLIGVTYMRMTFPVNIDFRYILPILIPFCYFFSYSQLLYEKFNHRRLYFLGYPLAVIFCISSILFFGAF